MKVWAYVAIVVALIGAIGGVYAAGHSSGYDKRDTEVKDQIIEAQEAARLVEERKWAAAVAASQENIKVETQIVETIREIEKEIPITVKEIQWRTPDCPVVHPDFVGLLNKQISAANSREDTEDPAGVVDAVSEAEVVRVQRSGTGSFDGGT